MTFKLVRKQSRKILNIFQTTENKVYGSTWILDLSTINNITYTKFFLQAFIRLNS